MKNLVTLLDDLIRKMKNLGTPKNSKIYYFLEPKTAFNEIEIYLN